MKTNIKLKVTPEQSEAVQKISFANNILWKPTNFNSNTTNVRFIFINPTNLTKCAYLSSNYFEAQKTGSTIKNLGLKALRGFKIPIPPLKEQERIVAILDKFDTLTTSISEGLPAEIEARKQQYEYYRDNLLNFEKIDIEVLI